MKLQQIDLISPQPPQAGFEVSRNDVPVPDVGDLQMILMLAGHTATLRRQDELLSAAGEKAADPLLTDAVVGRGVDEIDAGVKHGVEHPLRIVVAYYPHAPGPRSPEPHAAEAELRYF